MGKEQEKRKRRRRDESSSEESSESEDDVRRPPKRNRLLNPLVYEQWTVRTRTDRRIIYESPQNVGIAVYCPVDGAVEEASTLVAWKRPPIPADQASPSTPEDDKAVMCVMDGEAPPAPFAGRIEGTAGLPPHLPEDVRSSIAVLVRDVIHTCGVEPSCFTPQRTVREIVRDDATHYVYTIEYSHPASGKSIVLPLPLRSFSTLTPCKHASSMLLSKMYANEMTFTFCDKPTTAS